MALSRRIASSLFALFSASVAIWPDRALAQIVSHRTETPQGIVSAQGMSMPRSLGSGSDREETIEVSGQALVPIEHGYRRLERVFRRFDSFPSSDRAGLTLHMDAHLQPGDRSARGSVLQLQSDTHVQLLLNGVENEVVVPHDETLWQKDPPLYARLRPGEALSIGFFFTIDPQGLGAREHRTGDHSLEDPTRKDHLSKEGQSFTQAQARHWLGQLDRCIEDEGGFLLALLLPDTHKLSVDLAPNSRFEVVEHGVARLLVDNQGAVPYRFVFRPQDYARDAVFQSDRPFMHLVLTLPFALHGTLKRA